MASFGTLEPAKVIVAIDFGTTYSGFSYAHAQSGERDLENILEAVEGFEQWPSQSLAGARPYFKTQTSLLYMQNNSSRHPEYELKGWGWAAYVQYKNLQQNSDQLESKRFHFLTNFKLALAGPRTSGVSYRLPEGLTTERVIADYLHELSIVIEGELKKKYSEHISKKDVQWCLTVPAIWDDFAKQQMKKCAETAGLISGPSNVHAGEASPHPIIIVLEPEGASAYCMHFMRKSHETALKAGSKILIVDAGGGTVDLVLHEKVSTRADSIEVKEICRGSSGAQCGSIFVDEAFYELLSEKIPCYDEFITENPAAIFKIRKIWEDYKVTFDGELDLDFWLPGQLSNYWEDYSRSKGLHTSGSRYDEVHMTLNEITAVFDSVVDTILSLIENQIAQVASNDVDALLVVGGFSGSPYLMDRIKAQFDGRVKRIINPIHAGKAVVTGAVAYGCLGKDIVTARISRKTYGIGSHNFFEGPLIFGVYVRKGEEVNVNSCVKKICSPALWIGSDREGSIAIQVFSTTATDPSFVTDLGAVRECKFTFHYPAMKVLPQIEVSMFFGKTLLQLSAEGKNFKSEKEISPSVTLDASTLA